MTTETSVQFSCSVMSPWLWDAMDCSTSGLPVHHQLPEFTQTHVHWVGDAIQPYHPLSSPSSPAFNLSQHQGLFQWVSPLHQQARSASVLPISSQGWFPLGLTGFISLLSGDSQESSSAPQFESINSSVLSLLYGPSLISIHGFWKNHTFDYMTK